MINTKSFSTQSEIRTKVGIPKAGGMHVIGLDMGYSAPKGFHENGNFVFPNYCKKINGDIFGELTKNDLIHTNIATGEKHCVGNMAMKSLNEESVVAEDAIFGRNHYLDPSFMVTFETALGISLWDIKTDGSDVFLQTGLPPEYMVRDAGLLRSVIVGNHTFKLSIGQVTKTFDVTITDDHVDIMSQPMGTLNSLLYDENGCRVSNAQELMRSNLMIFDGGFGTLDKFIIIANEASKTTDGNLGMKRVMEETRKMIQEDFDITISIPAMQKILKTGKFSVNDMLSFSEKEYPVDSYLERANQLVCNEALESIREYVFKINYLIMTGGTGEAWFEDFKTRLSGAKVKVIRGNQNSNLPAIYSNARGYYFNRITKLGYKG